MILVQITNKFNFQNIIFQARKIQLRAKVFIFRFLGLLENLSTYSYQPKNF